MPVSHVRSPRRGVLRSPVVLFLVTSVLLVGAILLASNSLADRAARDEALVQAEVISGILAHSAAEPYVQIGLVRGRQSAADKFFRKADNLTGVPDVVSVDLINPDGTLIYSTDDPNSALERPTYPLSDTQRAVLRDGGTDSEPADPGSERSQDRAGDEQGLVKIFTRIDAEAGRHSQSASPKAEPVLFVAYWRLEGLESRRAEIFGAFRWITVGPLVLLVAISTIMLGLLTSQVRRVGRERARLLQAANDASDAERRRIARDLHDGVVQDLAGTQFAISGMARDPGLSASARDQMTGASAALRGSLRQMRSLIAEIYPPDLQGQGLQSALEDLIAPAAAAGIQASTSVEGLHSEADAADEAGATPDTAVALVWRVAQEAVRNTLRHSGASTLAVTVRADRDQLRLEVVDDGIGFDSTAPTPRDSFGLRGMRSLVQDLGGTLEVVSAVGEGTTVRMAVAR